jgi:hypothetical protein
MKNWKQNLRTKNEICPGKKTGGNLVNRKSNEDMRAYSLQA